MRYSSHFPLEFSVVTQSQHSAFVTAVQGRVCGQQTQHNELAVIFIRRWQVWDPDSANFKVWLILATQYYSSKSTFHNILIPDIKNKQTCTFTGIGQKKGFCLSLTGTK